VPVLSPRLSSYWLGLVTAVPANIARALIGGLKHDIPAHDEALRRLVPQSLLTFREAIDWLARPGFTCGRRDPVDLKLGDSVDYWTVIGVEPGRRHGSTEYESGTCPRARPGQVRVPGGYHSMERPR
jgi:hypothetical protein